MKLLILYYSSYGTNAELARLAAEAGEAKGAEVRVRKVTELAPDAAIDSQPAWRQHVDATSHIPVATAEDVEWSEAIIFSFPTRFGVMASQMKQFIDTLGGLWAQGKTVNKVVTAFTSTNTTHGGQEITVQSLYTQMMHWGAVIVTPGFTSEAISAIGNPYGISVTANSDESGAFFQEDHDTVKQAVQDMVHRLLDLSEKINA